MKKYLIASFILSLVAAGILGVFVLLSGKVDEVQIRILFSTLSFTVYSLIGLCCNSIIGTNYALVGKFGLTACVVGLVYAMITTWVTPHDAHFLQLRFSFLFVALCFAHCSLMLLIKKSNGFVWITIALSIICSVLATTISVDMLSSLKPTVDNFKFLAIVSIIGVISTIIAPILAATANKSIQPNANASAD